MNEIRKKKLMFLKMHSRMGLAIEKKGKQNQFTLIYWYFLLIVAVSFIVLS